MRILYAALVSVAILGGLQLYMTTRPERHVEPIHMSESMAEGDYTIELTLTFDAGPDAFALESTEAPSAVIQFRGRELLRETGVIPQGSRLMVSPVPDVAVGRNEFYVEVSPQDTQVNLSRGVRVRILRGGEPVADQTLWSEPGQPVQGLVTLQVSGSGQAQVHEH